MNFTRLRVSKCSRNISLYQLCGSLSVHWWLLCICKASLCFALLDLLGHSDLELFWHLCPITSCSTTAQRQLNLQIYVIELSQNRNKHVQPCNTIVYLPQALGNAFNARYSVTVHISPNVGNRKVITSWRIPCFTPCAFIPTHAATSNGTMWTMQWFSKQDSS